MRFHVILPGFLSYPLFLIALLTLPFVLTSSGSSNNSSTKSHHSPSLGYQLSSKGKVRQVTIRYHTVTCGKLTRCRLTTVIKLQIIILVWYSYRCQECLAQQIQELLETIVTVVLSLTLLLWSRVTPREHLRHPLSPLNTTFPFLLPLVFFTFFSPSISLFCLASNTSYSPTSEIAPH